MVELFKTKFESRLNETKENRYFGDLLIDELSKHDAKKSIDIGSIDQMNLIDSIKVHYPLLQLAVPDVGDLTIEDWNYEIEELPIALAYDLSKEEDITTIYPDGTTGKVSKEIAPDNLFLVISRNERVTVISKNTSAFSPNMLVDDFDCIGDPFLIDEQNEYVYTSDYLEAQNQCTINSNPGSGGGGSTPPSSQTCDRDLSTGKDELSRVKFTNISAYRSTKDGWFNGKLELKVFITLGNANGTPVELTKMFTNRETEYRSCVLGLFDCETRWVDFNAEIVTWDKDNYGDTMHYVFFEYDGNGDETEYKVKFPVTIGNTTIEIESTRKISVNDLPLGESKPEYCDDTAGEGYTYNTGTLFFQVRQR